MSLRKLVALNALTALVVLQWTDAVAVLTVPPQWFAVDPHVHWADSCWGVGPPQSIYDNMPADLGISSVLLWGGGGTFLQNAADYFRGQEDNPVSTPDRIVHYDLEISAFGLADRLGHGAYLNLADVIFPQFTYHAPIQDWAHAQGAIMGFEHAQSWVPSYDEFPPTGECCTPYEAPVGVALGRVDFLGYQSSLHDKWRFLWYTLLDCGFRPAIAATSDAWCQGVIGGYRTYVRLPGNLTYTSYVDALRLGRTVAVEEGDNFIHFTVDGRDVGDQIDVQTPAPPLSLVARVYLPAGQHRSGTIEIIRNSQVVGSRSYDQTGGEVELTVSDPISRSSWYAARTEKSHSGTVAVLVDGQPIRASTRSPNYCLNYLDYLRNEVEIGSFWALTPEDKIAFLADIAAARAIYQMIYDEALAATAGIENELSLVPLRLLGSSPNPFDLSTHIEIAARRAGPVVLHIFGPDGRRVRRLGREMSGGGEEGLEWDGLDEHGRKVPNGVYFYRLDADGRALARGRVVRAR